MAEITRDALLARRAQLADEEKLAWANLNAVLGAQQDIDYWLVVLAKGPGMVFDEELLRDRLRAEPGKVPAACGGCGAGEGQRHGPLCPVLIAARGSLGDAFMPTLAEPMNWRAGMAPALRTLPPISGVRSARLPPADPRLISRDTG